MIEDDGNCWQRPEDMRYKRLVSVCDETASDFAGEIIAALSAASIVFKEDEKYSMNLTKTAMELFDIVTKEEPGFVQGTYTMKDLCGEQARKFYNSTGYKDELVWGGTWLLFATGNMSYLTYATEHFDLAAEEESSVDKGIFYWNNKLAAIAVCNPIYPVLMFLVLVVLLFVSLIIYSGGLTLVHFLLKICRKFKVTS